MLKRTEIRSQRRQKLDKTKLNQKTIQKPLKSMRNPYDYGTICIVLYEKSKNQRFFLRIRFSAQ